MTLSVKVKRRSGNNRDSSSGRSDYHYDFFKHGVTQTFINLWLQCREQARLAYVEGWRSLTPSLPLEYGSAMHWLLAEVYKIGIGKVTTEDRKRLYAEYSRKWYAEHPIVPSDLRDMHRLVMGLVKAVLPVYITRACMPDQPYADRRKRWVHLESNFRIKWPFTQSVMKWPYVDRKTKTVAHTWLNGRFDGVFLDHRDRLWLFETKNFSMIDEVYLQETLPLNFQVMLYLNALLTWFREGKIKNKPIGCVYNVIRRPRIYRRKNEDIEPYCKRVHDDVRNPKNFDKYFMRWSVQVQPKEVDAWRESTLAPILWEMWQWWKSLQDGTMSRNYVNANSLQTKYGKAEMYPIITRGVYSGHYKRDVPFSELLEDS